MGRGYAPYLQKASPYKTKSFKPKSGLRFIQHSPRPSGAKKSRFQTTTNTSRFLKYKSTLPPVFEENPQDRGRLSYDAFREFDNQQDSGPSNVIEEDSDDNDEDMPEWDEETTLVSLLQDETPEHDERDFLIALAEQLKAPMSAQGNALKQDLVQTLVPTTKRVKEAHALMEERVDTAYGAGLLAFNEACKKVESMSLKDEDDLKTAFLRSQNKVKDLFKQLNDVYTRRDGLLADFEKRLDESAERAIADLRALPADLDRSIAQLEQKSKDLLKDGPTTKSKETQKMLKGLLEKLN